MIELFADLHIHIGRTTTGQRVKMAASDRLTFPGILREAAERKGLDMVGIVDCASVGVLDDVAAMIERGEMSPLDDGGLRYRDKLTVILAAEIGANANGREAHFLSFLPTYEAARAYSTSLAPYVTNRQLSSQKARLDAADLLALTKQVGGFFVPAHVFTPHKGYYGHCAARLHASFNGAHFDHIAAVELGLSADTAMAARISELDEIAFVSNSDAHSLKRIGREYNRIRVDSVSFAGLRRALLGHSGGIVTNYGLDPRLGKYHRTWCHVCDAKIPLRADRRCPKCGEGDLTVGVHDRLEEVADRSALEASEALTRRPLYVHQVPLEFVPGVGARTIDRLLAAFGTEMDILHRVTRDELAAVLPERVVTHIVLARSGRLSLLPGGGGVYGRVASRNADGSPLT